MEERRKFVRVKFLAEVEVVYFDNSYKAELLDLSLKGALIQPKSEIPMGLGNTCDLKIGLAAKDLTLEFKVELVHLNAEMFGLKFLSQDIDTMIHLRRLLELNACDHDRITEELSFLANP